MPAEPTPSSEIRNVVVTGAAGALGEVVCQHFLAAGCKVFGFDIAFESDEAQPSSQDQNFLQLKVDATQAERVRHAIHQAQQTFGTIDALIHVAGGFRWSKLEDFRDDDIDFLVDVNLRSTLYMVRAVLGPMKSQARGRIVLISSQSTLKPGVGESAYAATKAGINAVTLSVAAEVQHSGVTINAVLPSIIDTPANRQAMPDADFDTWVKRAALAKVIHSLTQPASEAINGALISVG